MVVVVLVVCHGLAFLLRVAARFGGPVALGLGERLARARARRAVTAALSERAGPGDVVRGHGMPADAQHAQPRQRPGARRAERGRPILAWIHRQRDTVANG